MTQIVHFQGRPVSVAGKLPKPDEQGKSFTLVTKDLTDLSLDSFSGKVKILNIFPSIDTTICAASVRNFDQMASTLNNTVVLCISSDLPFAQSRFCDAENLNNVITLSTLRGDEFKYNYGVSITDGMFCGLAARAVVVLDKENKVLYSELVNELTSEPNYSAILDALN
ncbi:thiol peroxidase [Serratia fonticola]|uniref:thiol peroxidase n=1 Tax=Serratia fonticola TaxID=47917 RepID=UPI00301BE65C